MMGLEEHLLAMFRDDFEFRDGAGSHLPPAAAPTIAVTAAVASAAAAGVSSAATVSATAAAGTPDLQAAAQAPRWSADGESELKKIPFFVRGKARRNTERYAQERGLALITVETLYEAKAHFGR
jgi:light-independent protochlorophyllide reductase subunit B